MGQIKELITSTEQIKLMQHETISQTTGIKKDIEALTNDVHDLKNANSALAKATSELSTKVAVLEEWRKHVEFKK